MKMVSEQIKLKVLALLNLDRGQKPSEIAAYVDDVALITVRHALRELCEDGRAKHTGENGCRHYFRAAQL